MEHAASKSARSDGPRLTLHAGSPERCMVVEFETPQQITSWAIYNGGTRLSTRVAWVEVRDAELGLDADPHALLSERLAALDVHDAVGMLTSRDLRRHVSRRVALDGIEARCIATVGLSNALRAGDPPAGPRPRPYAGTINLLCWVSQPLAQEGSLEGLCLAAEARTVAVFEAGVASGVSGLAASGTGTDCIAFACPSAPTRTTPSAYAGKHTLVGHLIGAAVHGAVAQATRAWCAEQEVP